MEGTPLLLVDAEMIPKWALQAFNEIKTIADDVERRKAIVHLRRILIMLGHLEVKNDKIH